MKNYYILPVIILLGILSSCVTNKQATTKAVAYKDLYEQRPLTIAIMPPINKTNNVEAKEFLYTTLSRPLSEAGYYILPTFLTLEMFKTESAYDAELFINGSLTKFRDVLGADAVIFTTINKWEKKAGWSNTVNVGIEYSIRTTKDNKEIFYRKGDITYDANVSSGGGGLIGLAIEKAASAINTAATDHVRVARACNNFVLSDIPAGKYSPNNDIDQTHSAGPKEVQATVKNTN